MWWCVIDGMTIALGKPGVDGLSETVGVLREWQYEGAPVQLHPGDLGWFWRFGPDATAEAVRTWSRGGRILAVGLLDGSDLLRLTIAPDAHRDEELARQLVKDVSGTERGVFREGKAYIEAPMAALVQELLAEDGWDVDEPWTPLRRDLAEPVEDPGVRIEVIGPSRRTCGRPYSGRRSTARRSRTSAGTRWRAECCTPTPGVSSRTTTVATRWRR